MESVCSRKMSKLKIILPLFVFACWWYKSFDFIYFAIVSLVFFAISFQHKKNSFVDQDFFKKTIKVFIIILLIRTADNPGIPYADNIIWFQILASASALLVVSSFFIKIKEKVVVSLAIFLLFISKVLVLVCCPEPHIDVFTSNTDASKYFLQGLNPYLQTYRDIYNGRYDYTPGFAYWPGTLLIQSLGQIGGDIRISHILCDIFSGIFIFKIIAKYQSRTISLLAVLFWFAMPFQNYNLQQAWVDTLLVAGFLGSFFFILEKKFVAAGIILGIFVSIKQYAGFYPLVLGMAFIGQKNYKNLFKLSISSLTTFLVILLPFLCFSGEGFLNMTIYTPLKSAFRPDSYSLTAWIFSHTEKIPEKWFFSLPALAILPTCMGLSFFAKSLEKSLLHTMLCYFVVFSFSKQSFLNYWYFASIFMLMYIFCCLTTENSLKHDRLSVSTNSGETG